MRLPSLDRTPIKALKGTQVAPRLFLALLRLEKIPLPDTEVRFHPTRRWRWDYAWPTQRLALEVQGGIWVQGRHSRGAGMRADFEKYNAGAILGWRLLLVEPKDLATMHTAHMIRNALAPKGLGTDHDSE